MGMLEAELLSCNQATSAMAPKLEACAAVCPASSLQKIDQGGGGIDEVSSDSLLSTPPDGCTPTFS